ncbi:hypothetical protein [Lysobacter sp. F60174L2]|uniref:hypothetical protein n=1 Tax=Lysobacter sp. F60174L2 TaxID=3459295 RepID=UPI00403DE07E
MTYRMTAQTFRFHSHQFQSRVRSAFKPRKPRHRLLRFAVGLVGLALIVLLVMFGVVVGAAMLVAGLAYKLWHGRGKPIAARRSHDPRVVDAEYRVVEKPAIDR